MNGPMLADTGGALSSDDTRVAVLGERDIDELALGYLGAVGGVARAGIGFRADGEGSVAEAIDPGIDAKDVAHPYRRDEGHGLDGDGCDAPARVLDRRDGPSHVHLAHHPAAENVARRIGIG